MSSTTQDTPAPMRPTSDVLHAIRDKEATARLVIEGCRREREALAAWMVLDGATSRSIFDVTQIAYNRIAQLRHQLGAQDTSPERARAVLEAAKSGAGVVEIARQCSVSVSYVYRLLHAAPPDAIEQAKLAAERIRAGMVPVRAADAAA